MNPLIFQVTEQDLDGAIEARSASNFMICRACVVSQAVWRCHEKAASTGGSSLSVDGAIYANNEEVQLLIIDFDAQNYRKIRDRLPIDITLEELISA